MKRDAAGLLRLPKSDLIGSAVNGSGDSTSKREGLKTPFGGIPSLDKFSSPNDYLRFWRKPRKDWRAFVVFVVPDASALYTWDCSTKCQRRWPAASARVPFLVSCFKECFSSHTGFHYQSIRQTGKEGFWGSQPTTKECLFSPWTFTRFRSGEFRKDWETVSQKPCA